VGDEAEGLLGAQEPAALHPDDAISLEVVALLDAADEHVPEPQRDAVARARASIGPRRLIRPYADKVPYGGPTATGRVRHPHLARAGKAGRPLCAQVFSDMVYGRDVVAVLEDCGILPQRAACDAEGCGAPGAERDVRVLESEQSARSAQRGAGQRAAQLPGPQDVRIGGRVVAVRKETAHYRCGRCGAKRAVGLHAEIWCGKYSLRQNASLFCRWAKSLEPSTEELALDAWLDHKRLVEGWVQNARDTVSEYQLFQNCTEQLGGPGVEVEIDEVCFRARWAEGDDGNWGREWHRYIAAHERHGGKLVLMALPPRFASGQGQGGGGALSNEELHDFIFRPNSDGLPLLRPGTIVHTDGAKAYRNLDWRTAHDAPRPPSEDELMFAAEALQGEWRLETFRECLARCAGERRDWRDRSEEWAAKYRHLRLCHTSVCHSRKVAGRVEREFTAMRLVHIHPDDVAAVEAVDPRCGQWGGPPHDWTWRKGGTQTVDGHWRNLRRGGSHRGVNTSLTQAVSQAVLVHQWAYRATPSANMLSYLGDTLVALRAQRAADLSLQGPSPPDAPAGSPWARRDKAVAEAARRAGVREGARAKAKRAAGASAAARQRGGPGAAPPAAAPAAAAAAPPGEAAAALAAAAPRPAAAEEAAGDGRRADGRGFKRLRRAAAAPGIRLGLPPGAPDPRLDPVRHERLRFQHVVDEARAAERAARAAGPPAPPEPVRPRHPRYQPGDLSVLGGHLPPEWRGQGRFS